ncbi:MAG: DUF1071 domain-containing protein [Nanoarchaeota archaeon]
MVHKYGTIKVVASTGGIILREDDRTWINPANDDIKSKVIEAKEHLVGKPVSIMTDESDKYLSVELAENEEDVDEDYSEEDIDVEADNKLDEKLQKEVSRTPKKEKIESKESYFTKLNKVDCKVERKMGLNYISWADAWYHLKRIHPDANYNIYCNENGLPYFRDESGVFAKVGVTVENKEHIMVLPVLDNTNKSVEKPNVFQINKTIMRCFAKAMAMHGIGTYVFLGEDIPKED